MSKQWALLNPDNQLTTMSTSVQGLEDMLNGLADEGEGWAIVEADADFFSMRPELVAALEGLGDEAEDWLIVQAYKACCAELATADGRG